MRTPCLKRIRQPRGEEDEKRISETLHQNIFPKISGTYICLTYEA